MSASNQRDLADPVRRFRSALFRLGTPKALGCDLVAHFSYHKCLTAYYQSIMRALSAEFGFYYEHFTSDYALFEHAALNDSRQRVLSVNYRSDIAWDRLPEYRGSHFVRDPRNLVVSGYRYHLWTREACCHDPGFEWQYLTAHPYWTLRRTRAREVSPPIVVSGVYQHAGPGAGHDPRMDLAIPSFRADAPLGLSNPRIMEVRYEDIIGNEADTFGRLLEHYGFAPSVVARGVALAERKSIKHRPKSEKSHVRSGAAKQWEKEFTPLLRMLFRESAGHLLVQLGYEASTEW